jgi:hypothetical protein
MVHHYKNATGESIQCFYCMRIFPTESGTMLFPVTKIRCCVECYEMMHEKYASDL